MMVMQNILSTFDNKKARIFFSKSALVLGVLLSVFLVCSVFAAHVINTSGGGTSYNINEDVGFVYNISVNISDNGQDANVTQVNITIPGSFTFIGSEGTDSTSSFANTTTVLSWSNFTNYAINGSALKYFWFNTTAATPGNYNISVMTVNGTGAYYNNISVSVNDTTAPEVTNVFPANGGAYNSSGSSFNITISDNVNVSSCWVSLNSGTTNYTMTLSSGTAASYTNSSIGEALYTAKYYCNDTTNNINGTINTTFRIDRTAPVVRLLDPDDDDSSTSTTWDFDFNVTDSGGSGISRCTLIIDGDPVKNFSGTLNSTGGSNTISKGSQSVDSHDWNIECIDYASNLGTDPDDRTFTVESSGSEGSGGGSTSTTATTWTNSFSYNDVDFSLKQPLTRDYQKKYRVSFKLGGASHYMGVKSLTSTSATIEVASTPQAATLNVGESQKFDVTDDDFYDVLVKLNNITGSKASITTSYIHEKVPDAPADEEDEIIAEPELDSTNNATGVDPLTADAEREARIKTRTVVFLVIGIIAIIVVAYYIYRRNKRGY